MKKTLLFTALTLACTSMFAQTQIGNGDMELWDDIGSATEEPQNWSGIKTASGNGLLITFAPQAITRSTDTQTGSGYSARLVSVNALGTTANGTMTCGSLNVGSATASDPSNYAWTVTGDPIFSEACTDTPDSIVWWAKYTPINNASTARMKATLHDDYDYIDPEDATSTSHVVATAVSNYTTTNGQWMRFSVPFTYGGPASNNTYILVTFTTNTTPGGGDPNDEVLIDDVELIYNGSGAGINELSSDFNVIMNNENAAINFLGLDNVEGTYSVFDMSGSTVQNGELQSTVPFNAPTGIYFVNVEVNNQVQQFKIYKK